MTLVYRLCSSRFAAESGVGAALYGGRWNGVGTAVVYAAESAALAALEVLVHFSVLPGDFALTEIAIPDELLVVQLDVPRLPLGWDGEEPIVETQEMGDDWVRGGASAILSVPSTIIPDGRNYLLNPAHKDFSAVVFGRSTPFRFDPRLK